jgi:hypothetical protein
MRMEAKTIGSQAKMEEKRKVANKNMQTPFICMISKHSVSLLGQPDQKGVV